MLSFSGTTDGLLAARALKWGLPRLAVYVVVAVAAPLFLLLGAAFYTYVWPGFTPPQVSPPPDVPSYFEPAKPSPPPPIPIDQPIESSPSTGVAVAAIPPPSALIGAQVIAEGSAPVWRVVEVGLNNKGDTISVILKNDVTQERASAPVHAFGWRWDPKKANAPAVAHIAGSQAKSSWIWYTDKSNSSGFILSPGPPQP
jgi:hypothetical protein